MPCMAGCRQRNGPPAKVRVTGRSRSYGYLTVTEAPAPSRAAFALSAASLLTFPRTVFGAPSTRSCSRSAARRASSVEACTNNGLAPFRPRLLVGGAPDQGVHGVVRDRPRTRAYQP